MGSGSDVLDVSDLPGDVPFGAVVRGLTLPDLAAEGIRRALHDLWIDKGVLVFEPVEGEEFQLELSRCFGKLIAHPAPESRAAHPELTTVRYRPEDGWLLDVDGEKRGSWLPWHSDLIYVDRINRGGVLRPVELPSALGETGFIDKAAAYDTLPDELKAEIEDLDVVYKYDLDPARQKFGCTATVTIDRYTDGIRSIQGRLDDFPRVVHPMVYQQRETGRTLLNVSPWFAIGILGMMDDEGDALLERVVHHIVNGAGIYMHRWTMGQMVLWDNWRMLHSSTGCPSDEQRWMLRTTIEGDYGLGRTELNAEIDRSRYISF